ncbi:chromatin assembly factor 1 subunit A [Carica papaya]|uniref:chromatin assembly factor 1 subunit A n=1 Tax=Carica papaya TaxID=3649 RepID=UPI000B8D0AF2|nr:chromatin assembly factor 1 subunit A [Carica papaya]
MKSVKGRLLKKLKSIKPIGYLQQDRVLQVLAADAILDFYPKRSNSTSGTQETQLVPKDQDKEEENNKVSTVAGQEPDMIDVAELMRELREEEEKEEEEEEKKKEDMDLDHYDDDKENVGISMKGKDPVISSNENVKTASKSEMGECRQKPLSEIDISSFRRPELESNSLFDPNLLAAFEQAVKEHMRTREAERIERTEQKEKLGENRELETEEENDLQEIAEMEPPQKTRRLEDDGNEVVNNNYSDNPLLEFEERCPPGGDGSVVFYSTTLRGIRKTFEDCNRVRFLLESFRLVFLERDVSMHREYKEELWRIMEGKTVPPRLFIMGRYIGGAQEVLGLHEQGKLKVLFEGIPPADMFSEPCEGCAGARFVLCYRCRGSHKLAADGDGLWSRCPECNENGLIICPFCC